MFDKGYMRDKRRVLGLTQQDLAVRIGVNQQSIHKWEAGEVVPRGKNAEKLAEALGVDVGVLFPGMAISPAKDIRAIIRATLDADISDAQKLEIIRKVVE